MANPLKSKPTLEEDVDDLDDVLDQFLASPPPPPPTATTSSSFSTGRPRTNTRVDQIPRSAPGHGLDSLGEDALTDEFSKELAKGMESLMREIGGEEPGQTDGNDEATQRALKAAWEAMLVEGMDGMAAGEKEDKGDFQTKIRETMDRLKRSESNLQSSPDGPSNPESIESLLASLKDLGLGAEGGGEGEPDEAELAGFLENLMGSLMSKDVLYEPLKELTDKFPGYLASPPTPLTADEKSRYQSQLTSATQIVQVFEDVKYNENDSGTKEKLVTLMAEMQSHGAPPKEIMGDLPPGFGFGFGLGQDGMPNLGPDGCVIS